MKQTPSELLSSATGRDSAAPISAAQLAELPFFAGLGESELEQISAYTKLSRFAAGETILEQGDLANRFYVILSGVVVIERNFGERKFVVEKLGPGSAVGFSWLVTPENLHFTARAMGPVTAVFFYGTLLREDCEIDSRLGFDLLQRATKTLLERLEAFIACVGKELAQKPQSTVDTKSVLPFHSSVARGTAGIAALGFLAALGFIPGWERLFGMSGFFGFFGVAFIIEAIHRIRNR